MTKLSINLGVGENIVVGTIIIPIDFFRMVPILSIQELFVAASSFKTIHSLDDWMDIDGVDSAYYLKITGSIVGMIQFYQYISQWFGTYTEVEKVITTKHISLSKELVDEITNMHSNNKNYCLL